MRRRAVVECDHRPAPGSSHQVRYAHQDRRRRVELERQRMDSRRLQPDDVVARFDFRFAVVMVRDVMMEFEMTVDDGVRVRGRGFVRVQGCHT
jgi:hypothetical protein